MTAIFLLAAALAGANGYEWPLDIPKAVTSSFGEYRTGRFHAGLDLRTQGVGRPVHAARDGYVARLRVSPWGYGKAVYLQLDDGITAVYAHLSSFTGPIADYVQKAQHATESYTVDLTPAPGELPVKRGDVVARTGQTGVGQPHLHYELRDSAGRPINPRTLGLTWPDETRPAIRRVLVIPEGPDSSVNGDLLPLTLTPKHFDQGHYRCPAVRASGRIGFGIDVIDPANAGASRLGIHQAITRCGEQTLFRVVNDRISYTHIRDGIVAWHPFLLTEGRFLLLWRWPHNNAEPYCQSQADGWFVVPDKPTEIHIQVADFLGNETTLTIPIKPDTATETKPANSEPGNGKGKISIKPFGDWIALTATFASAEPNVPRCLVEGMPLAQGGAFRRVDAKTFRLGLQPVPHHGELRLGVDHPRLNPFHETIAVFQRGEGDKALAVDDASVLVHSTSPYGMLLLCGERIDATNVPPARIPTLGAAYRLWPPNAPIDHPIDVSLPLPEGAEQPTRVDIYRCTGGTWSREDTRRAGHRLIATTRRLGVFLAMEDTIPPHVSPLRLTATNDAQRPHIRASLSDVGSGIASVTATCNDQWLLMEYDPERGTVAWARDEDLPQGRREFLLRVIDQAGNVTTRSR